MTLRNDKVQDNKLKSFWKQKSEVSIKHFAKNGKEKLFVSDSLFISNWKNAKTDTIQTI